MTDWSVAKRHTLTAFLDSQFSDPLRLEALSRAAGLETPSSQGAEPSFAALSRLVRAAAAAGTLDGLSDLAGTMLSDELAEQLAAALAAAPAAATREEPVVEEEPAAEVEEEPAAEVEEEPAAQAEEAEVVAAAPRPPGTPAQAAPTDGASGWLLRTVGAEHPESINPGENLESSLVLSPASASDLSAVPNEAADWSAGPVSVDWEASIEGAATAGGTQMSGSFSLSSEAVEAKVELPLMVAFSLDGVQIQVSFFAAGYEVGRARVVVPGRSTVEDGEAAGGVIAIPDTILA